MPHDLAHELLRVAREFVDAHNAAGFTCDDISRFIRAARSEVRLAHPYVHGMIASLMESLATEGLVEREGETFHLTGGAHAYLDREPELLIEPAGEVVASKVGAR